MRLDEGIFILIFFFFSANENFASILLIYKITLDGRYASDAVEKKNHVEGDVNFLWSMASNQLE